MAKPAIINFDGLSFANCFDTALFVINRQPFAALRVNIFQGDKIMASHDMDKAQGTYDGFMGTLKWAVPVICVITLFVVVLIAP